MKIIQILVCLAVIYSCSSVQILQSTTSTTTIVSSPNVSTVYSSYYNSLKKNIAGPGVQWITVSRSPTIYQSLFYASCIGSANLTITAASSFNAFLDRVYIGSGSNYSKAYNFPVKITCGNHNLTIIVYSSEGTSEGLTFGLNQDQSNCYNCQVTGYWNEYSCACSCITSYCPCRTPKVWKDYPVCGCACPSLFFIDTILPISPIVKQTSTTKATAVSAAANLAVIKLPGLCSSSKYYNQELCSCVCHIAYCPPSYNYDQVNCKCVAIIK